jgi:glycosyltransferase involved in cell wall biosynthesis
MPCFNYARYLGGSIRSVLNQTESDLELIVIEDGSSDASGEVLARLAAKDNRIKPIYHPANRGISPSRNEGLKKAAGDYIAFCDADDIWLPDKLEKQLALLSQNPKANLAYGDSKIIDGHGKETGALFSDRFPVPDSGNGDLFSTLCVRNFINTQTVLLRHKILRPDDYFNPEISYGEDWLFWTKLARLNSFLYNPEPLCLYRVHEESSTAGTIERKTRNRVKVYLEILRLRDLPRSTLSAVFYHLGVALAALPGEAEFCPFAFKTAVKYNPLNLKAAYRLIAYQVCHR